MRLAEGLLVAAAAFVAPGCAALGHVDSPVPRVRGPLPIRSNHPLGLNFLAMTPRRPVVVPAGENAFGIQAAYASIHEIDANLVSIVAFDGEIGRLAGRWRRGVGKGFDVEVELAGVWAAGGFLDEFVEAFHSFFALGNQGREFFPENQFDMRLVHQGQLIYQHEEETFGAGDVPIIVTRQVRVEDDDGPGLAVRVGVELPTASESAGRGNGQLDFGVGFLGERTHGRWTTTGALGLVLTGQPSSFDGSPVDIEDVVDLQAGVEYRWSDAVSLVAELVVLTHMVDQIELEEIDSPILEFGAGLAIDGPGESLWRLAFQEDLLAASGTDFTAFLGWTSGM